MLTKKQLIFFLSIFLLFNIIEKSFVYGASTASHKYFQAEKAWKKLLQSPKKHKYRDSWLYCIEKFKAVYKHDSSGEWASAGLYMTGHLYHELYKISFLKSDKKEAVDHFERLLKRFTKSGYIPKARSAIKELSSGHKKAYIKKKDIKKKFNNKTSRKPENKTSRKSETKKEIQSKPSPKKKSNPKKPVSKPKQFKKTKPSPSIGKTYKTASKVTEIRYWSNPNYTRIVIDADIETSYTHNLLKHDPKLKKPQRLYVDLKKSRLDKDIQKTIPINDNLLKDARAGQFTKDTVRVVVDIKSFNDYKIFSLKNPFRIVLDVWGSNGKVSKPLPKKSDIVIKQSNEKLPPGALAKQLVLGVKRIVIDPGHGGKDYGAPGYIKGVHEKNIVLQIAKKLSKKIRQQLGCEVIMTRSKDRYLTLEERTAIANTKNADLFISIHTNAVRSKRAYGTETYFLNLATDNDAISVAARENATSTKNISDLQSILNDLMQNSKINESSRLAANVQQAMCKKIAKKYSKVKNKGVKQAPFYVLLGARMPAILIETAFISNPRECERLMSSKYQNLLCDSIIEGIRKYISEMCPVANLGNKNGV